MTRTPEVETLLFTTRPRTRLIESEANARVYYAFRILSAPVDSVVQSKRRPLAAIHPLKPWHLLMDHSPWLPASTNGPSRPPARLPMSPSSKDAWCDDQSIQQAKKCSSARHPSIDRSIPGRSRFYSKTPPTTKLHVHGPPLQISSDISPWSPVVAHTRPSYASSIRHNDSNLGS